MRILQVRSAILGGFHEVPLMIPRFAAIPVIVLALSLDVLAQTAPPRITPDVVYGHKDGLALTFDVYTPPNANGAGVLFMVSGGWVSAWAPPEGGLRRFELPAEQRVHRVQRAPRQQPRYKVPDAAADVERAVRFIKLNATKFGVDPGRLGAYGGSAGGHLSLMLGLDPDPGDAQARDEVLRGASGLAAVVALFPPVDLRGWTGPSKDFPALDFDADLASSCPRSCSSPKTIRPRS
jgi:acetyl esterase/lipase